MPLYTYIATYRGGSYVEQDRRSNFSGFTVFIVGAMPERALPGFDKAVRKSAIEKILTSEWMAVANRKHVWRTSFELRESEFVLYAVQTDQ